jgi:hypothetical protein
MLMSGGTMSFRRVQYIRQKPLGKGCSDTLTLTYCQQKAFGENNPQDFT